jgi:hypothetical protein
MRNELSTPFVSLRQSASSFTDNRSDPGEAPGKAPSPWTAWIGCRISRLRSRQRHSLNRIGEPANHELLRFISGHSTFSAAAATVLQLFTGSDRFGDSVTFATGTSAVEPGITPASPVTLYWDRFTAAANQSVRFWNCCFRNRTNTPHLAASLEQSDVIRRIAYEFHLAGFSASRRLIPVLPFDNYGNRR